MDIKNLCFDAIEDTLKFNIKIFIKIIKQSKIDKDINIYLKYN